MEVAMDAIVKLRDDHKRVEKQFKVLEKGDLSVVPEICRELTVHATLEETIFYPAVRTNVDDSQDEVGESVEEHHLVKILVSELEQTDPADETYRSKATVLMELVRHHVDEEETEMFPQVRAELGRKRLQELGDEMAILEQTLV
jgi:hemerythrin superfamily protein